MSYTPSIKFNNRDYGSKLKLEEVIADLFYNFFNQKHKAISYLPSQLMLGQKTFKAARKLFSYKSTWFNNIDKAKYLIEGNLKYTSGYFWGILSKLWPRKKAKVVSDLFTNSRNKLQAILFLEIAKNASYKHLLPMYFNRYMTDGLRNYVRRMIVRSYSSLPYWC